MTISLWHDPENCRLLRELSFLYLYKSSSQEGGQTIADLAREIQRRSGSALGSNSSAGEPNILDEAAYQMLRRFMFFETRTIRKPELLEKLFGVVVGWLHDTRNSHALRNTYYLDLLDQNGWFKRWRYSNEVSNPNLSSGSGEVAKPLLSARELSAVEMFRSFFNTSDREFELAAKSLTGQERCQGPEPTDNDRQGFITYRYSSTPGNVVKTFTVVTPPCDAYPYCFFRNFYRYEDIGLERESTGLVIRLARSIYMLGRVDDGEAIKMIVLPHVTPNANITSGLVLTTSEHGAPLVSRVVLEKCTFKHSADVAPTVIKFENVDNEIKNREIIRRLRNYTTFEIGKKVYSEELKDFISAERLVDLVDKYCKGRFTLDKVPFNPADHRYYLFNQALLAYDAKEKYI